MENEFLLKIPYGMRDFLPPAAAGKRRIERALSELFALWGYEEVATPAMEYLSTLTLGNIEGEEKLFKLFDEKGQTTALHHDMTTPIARLAASRLKEARLPLKLSYIEPVFRREKAQEGRLSQFYQGGVELIGSSGPEADAEIIALAIYSLRRVGLQDFSLVLGEVEFIGGILTECSLEENNRAKIRALLTKHDLVGLKKLVASLDISSEAREKISAVPHLFGGEEVLEKAEALAQNPESMDAVRTLREIYRLLKEYGAAEEVRFDLGLVRDFDYYTGMVFEVYNKTLGFPLCGGGRYDAMLKSFGKDAAATGFSLGIERILLALEREGEENFEEACPCVYVAYGSKGKEAAIREAMDLRSKGFVTRLALEESSREAAEEKAREFGGELRYLE